MDPIKVTDWLSVVIAAASLAIAAIAIFLSRRSEARAVVLEKRNAELAEKQALMGQRSWTDAYFRDVTSWAMNVAQAISDAVHLCEQASPSPHDVRDILARLSAAIDTGRWYFPNHFENEAGQYKEPAYRGYRQPVLNHVVDAYRAFEAENRSASKHRLVHDQRCFVSEIQLILDPRKRSKVIAQTLVEFDAIDRARQQDKK